MAVSSVRKNYLALFWILTIVVYFVGLIIINRGLGFRNIGIFGVMLEIFTTFQLENIGFVIWQLSVLSTLFSQP